MLWERGLAVIQCFYGGLFILHPGFTYYLSHISALLLLCLIASASWSFPTCSSFSLLPLNFLPPYTGHPPIYPIPQIPFLPLG